MAFEVWERMESRRGLARVLQAYVEASGGICPAAEMKKYAEGLGFRSDLILDRIETLGLERRGQHVILAPVQEPQTDLNVTHGTEREMKTVEQV